MANTFKNAHGEAAASSTVVYTCPGATTAIIFAASFSNIDGTNEVAVTVETVDTSASTTKTVHSALPIPIKDTYALDSKIVLEATDTIKVSAGATGDIDYTLSILEIS